MTEPEQLFPMPQKRGSEEERTTSSYIDPSSAGSATDPTTKASSEAIERAKENADVAYVHSLWVELAQPRVQALTPSRARLLQRAIADAGRDVCADAVRGLIAWANRKGDGRYDLSRAFKTRPGGDCLTDQIEFFASQAPTDASSESLARRVPTGALDRARTALAAARDIGTPFLVEKADEEERKLLQYGLKVKRDAEGKFRGFEGIE